VSKLQSQHARFGLKAILGSVLALTLAGAFAVASQGGTASSSPRQGALHLTKTCAPLDADGKAGAFCTIEGSNLRQIAAGAKVFYLEPAGASSLDSDVVLYAGPGNIALGHVTLSFTTPTPTGEITFAGGTGSLGGFHARAAVSFDGTVWHWDGTYRFSR
jgi:hypothetical protein